MNKYLKIGLCLLLTIFVFTGCENKANETKKEDDNSLSVYEYHYYDNDFITKRIYRQFNKLNCSYSN